MPETAIARRSNHYFKALKSGRLSFNDGQCTVECTVTSMSETCANVVMISTFGLPTAVELVLEDGSRRHCRVADQSLTELTLEFIGNKGE